MMVAPALSVDNGVLVGIGAAAAIAAGMIFFAVAGRISVPSRAETLSPAPPSIAQGCAMVIGGVIIGFGACSGAFILGGTSFGTWRDLGALFGAGLAIRRTLSRIFPGGVISIGQRRSSNDRE